MDVLLNSFAEIHAIEACNLSTFRSINLRDIKAKVASMLGMIGRDDIFSEYTSHTIDHVNGMLVLLNTIIPKDTQDKMTQSEWLLLVLAVYFHDLGMLVTKKEYNERLTFSKFVEYRDKYLTSQDAIQSLRSDTDEGKNKFIYQEFVRHSHGDRIYSWIMNEEQEGVPYDNKVLQLVQDMVSGMPALFKKDLALVCRSHSRDDIDNTEYYRPKQWYGQEREERANVFYIALLLRTADLLHITSDRTPSVEYQIISPTNPKSQDEWAKQRAIASVQPKDKVDLEGNVDETQPDTFQINAVFPSEEGFFALIDYLNYSRSQLQMCFQLNERINKKYGTDYSYPWRDIDDSSIQTESFDREQLSFTIDQVKILDLLVGETLYNNYTVAIRELVQNAIDAVRVREYELGKNAKDSFEPNVVITWDSGSRDLIISDNGTGMNMEIIKNHLLKVGSSRYRDSNFIKNHPGYYSISRFGIGLLTCFLVADDVDILTQMGNEVNEKPLLLKIRNLQGKYLLKYGAEKGSPLQLIGETGTSIRLRIRSSISSFDPESQLRSWILFPGCDIRYREDNYETQIGYKSPSVMLESLLEDHGDMENYKVSSYRSDGIEMALLLKKNNYVNVWELVETNDYWIEKQNGNSVVPWGLAVEGIRINYDTPGFDSSGFIAFANCFGAQAPRTNVARSSVSSDSTKNLLESLYCLLLDYINEQKEGVSESFSMTWANDETRWLLGSMLTEFHYNSAQLLDDDIFNERLADYGLVLVEEKDQRHFCSMSDLRRKGHFWTVESESILSANKLIREMHGVKRSALSVLKLFLDVSDKSLDDIDILYCDSIYDGVLEEMRLSLFEVSRLVTIENQRRLDMKWELVENPTRWFKVDLGLRIVRRTSRLSSKRFYFQVSDDICFELPSQYEAIKSRYGIFFPKTSRFTEVLNVIRSKFDENKKETAVMAEVFCSYVEYLIHRQNEEDVLSFEQHIERIDMRIKPELFDLLPLSEIHSLTGKNYLIYDTGHWYRS